jgi:hypothetical protein
VINIAFSLHHGAKGLIPFKHWQSIDNMIAKKPLNGCWHLSLKYSKNVEGKNLNNSAPMFEKKQDNENEVKPFDVTPKGKTLARDLFSRNTETVALELLGKHLVHRIANHTR